MTDPLDDLIQRKKAEQLKASVKAGSMFDPDEYARKRKAAQPLGANPAAIDDTSAFERAAMVQGFDFDKFIREAPRTSSWASTPDRAALSYDDLDTLAQIEAARTGHGTIRAMTSGEKFRFNYVDPVVRKLQSFPLTRAAIATVGGSAGMIGNAGSFFGIHGSDGSGKNAFQKFQRSLDPEVTGADTIMGSRHTAFDTLAQQVGPLIPATLLSGGTATVGRIIGLSDKAVKIAGGLGTGALFTADQGGATYTSMIESGATPEQARAAANKVAAINAPVNALFGFTHVIPALESRPIATATGMGALQGATGRLAQNLVAGKPWHEGLGEGAVEGAALNVGMDLGFRSIGVLGDTIEMAKQSKLRVRDEGAFREAMSEVFAGHEKLRVPVEQWDALWQSANRDPIQEARRLGLDYTEAKATGEIHIPTEDFLAKIDPEQQKALLPDVVDPKMGMTPRQYTEAAKELEQWQKGDGPEKLRAMAEGVDKEAQGSTEYKAVKEELRRRYEAVGERPEVADSYATLQANVYANLAKQTGLKPTELLTLYDPKITIGEAPAAAPQINNGLQFRTGGKNPVQVDGVHYSQAEGLTALDPAYTGSATRGAEMKRLAELPAEDPLRKRVYFYVSKDGEIPAPERLVRGDQKYGTRLANLYDIEADPEGIWTAAPDANAKERAVIEAGYDGYVSPAPGKYGSAVLLGTDAVPVRSLSETLQQGPVISNRELLRTSRQVIGGLEKGTFAEFKAAMKERLGAKAAKELEFGGEKGDKAMRLAFEKAQEKELPGAPSTVRTPEDRQALLDNMVAMAKQGEAGRFWYDDSAKAFLELAGGDRLEAFKLATLTALYSPQTSVADNGRRAILAYYDAQHQMAVSAGGVHPNVKQLAQRVMDAKSMEEVAAVMSGQKTSAFQQNLLNLFAPEHANDDIATIDLHMMRAFGYDTEAPTPVQYKWAEQLTRDVATELGWGSPKEAQAAIWVAQKMKTDNGGKGSTAGQAGFHYGDAAKKISGAVNVEAMPGSDVVREIFPGIDKANRAQLEQYHREKMDIVRQELKKAGVMIADESTGHGYWDGVSNPVTSFKVPLPHIGGEADHQMAPSARAEIERAAKVVLDVVGDQDAIGWNKPFASTSVGEANATHYELARELNVEEMKALGDAFSKAGLDAFIDASDPKNIKVINYNWEGVTKGEKGAAASKLAKQYHKSLNDIISNALPDGMEVTEHLFNAESGLVSKETTNAGQTETGRVPAEGAPAVQAGGEPSGRAQIEALNERYRREYGWGTPDPNDLGTRGRSGEVLYQSGPDGLTPGWSGTELLSNEELRRQQRGDTYYRVDRSGRITYLGAQPDATVRNGEAIFMVDGLSGKTQVQNSMGLGPDAGVLARFGDRVSKAHADLRTLYAGSMESPRGWFRQLPDGSFEIGKTKIGDLSTFVHEPAHGYLFMIDGLLKREGASEMLKEDARKIAKFLGADNLTNLTREQHETWARANEQYLREGKAPSEGLRGVFQRFSIWLSSVYRKASQLGVELNDDIRGVFDRLYATEEGVNRAHEDVAGPQLFNSPEEAGWTEAEFKRYAESKGMEVDQAKADILAKMNEAALREKTAAWIEEERNVREAMSAEVDKRPDQTAIRTLRKGTMDDGTPLALNREELVKQFGEERVLELQKKHPNLYRHEGGVDAETAAELLGFASGQELFDTLHLAPKRSEAIAEATKQFMTEKHGDIRYDGSLQDKATLAVMNEKRAENLHKEIEGLERRARAKNNPEAELARMRQELAAMTREDKAGEAQQAKLEKRDSKIVELKQKIADMEAQSKWETQAIRQSSTAARELPPVAAFRATAQNMIESKPIMELDPNKYLNAQRRYSREAYDQMAKGDYYAAKDAKQRELMNHFLFTEATKAKAETEKTYAYVRKFGKPSIREKIGLAGGEQGQHVYLDQIDQLLEQFDFTEKTNRAIRARQSLESFMRDRIEEGEEIVIDQSIIGLEKNYRELTLPELRAVRDAIRNIEALAKNEYGFIRDGKRISFETEAQRFDETVRTNLTSKPVPRAGTNYTSGEKAGRWLRGVDSYMMKMEWLVDALDGGDINGPARENIKRPIDEANARRSEMAERVFGRLKELVDARPEADLRDAHESTGVTFPGMDRPLTRRQLVSWALNLGTEENRKVALLGEGLINPDGSVRPEFDQALSAMRASELKFVQGAWDVLNTLLPDIKAKALRVTGVEPKLKRVVPFEVKSVDGEVVKMEGGYYPLKGDPILNDVGRRQQDPSQRETAGFNRPVTNQSHLKEVTGATYRLMLDYEHVLGQHLSDVINDTAAGEAISQVYKFISNKKVYQAMQETLGEKEASEFLPWLQSFANNRKGDPTEGGPLIRFLMSRRTGMVAARLGGNLGSYLIQTGDVFKALADPDVKTSHLAKAFLDIRRNPQEVIDEIRQLSPNEMRHREQNFNREIRDMLTSKTIFEEKNAKVTEFLMQGFQVMDRFVTFPVWLARYRQGLAEHGDPTRAVAEADRVIARSFQAGESRNMSRMMREQGMMKLFTTFQGDANTWYGLISSSVRSGDVSRISVGIMALIAEQLVGQAIKNRLPSKDDEHKGAWLAEQVLMSGLGKIPVFGDLSQYTMDTLRGKHASLENPTMQTMEKVFSSPKSVADYAAGKKDGQEAAQDVLEAAGLWMGIPGTSQAIRSWRYAHKVSKGQQNPTSPLDYAAGLAFGAKPKEKK